MFVKYVVSMYNVSQHSDLKMHIFYSWCSWSCPGISQRMLSVQRMAYSVKADINRTENTKSQSMLFTGTAGRGPKWSSLFTA